jgi:hypothetical protein
LQSLWLEGGHVFRPRYSDLPTTSDQRIRELGPLVYRTPAAVLARRQVTVWAWSGLAADEGDAAAEYLSAYLGLPVRLVRYIGSAGHQRRMGSLQAAAQGEGEGGEALVRETCPEFAVGFETSFADGFPLLLTSEVRHSNHCSHTP